MYGVGEDTYRRESLGLGFGLGEDLLLDVASLGGGHESSDGEYELVEHFEMFVFLFKNYNF